MNKYGSLFVGVVFIAFSVPADAQDWSSAQREVLEFEEACWRDRTPEFVDNCVHSDFEGWGLGSTVPTNKADRGVIAERSRVTEDFVYLFFKPIAITVHGDMATALYVVTYTTKNKASGEEKTVTERWTDVLVKDGGKWFWIADHGVDISTN